MIYDRVLRLRLILFERKEKRQGFKVKLGRTYRHFDRVNVLVLLLMVASHRGFLYFSKSTWDFIASISNCLYYVYKRLSAVPPVYIPGESRIHPFLAKGNVECHLPLSFCIWISKIKHRRYERRKNLLSFTVAMRLQMFPYPLRVHYVRRRVKPRDYIL